jgi:hypothetical protein
MSDKPPFASSHDSEIPERRGDGDNIKGRLRTAVDMMRNEGFRLLSPHDCLTPAMMAQDHDTTGYPLRDDVRLELYNLVATGTLVKLTDDEWKAAGLPGDDYSIYAYRATVAANKRTSPPNGSESPDSTAKDSSKDE